MQTIDVLSLPGFKDYIDPNSFDKQNLINSIKEKSKSKIKDNTNNWDKERYSSIEQGAVDFTTLESIYHTVIQNMISTFNLNKKKVDYKFNISNYTLANNEHAIRLHEHTTHGDFTMLHYLSYDKEIHSPTMFLNTHIFGQYMESIRNNMYNIFTNNFKNSWLHREFYIDMKEDEILIMPSTIPHYVPPRPQVDKDRIVVATNIVLG